jgi:Cell wall-active antibiotics response 4TMS YvqF
VADGPTITQVPRLGIALLGGYRASGRLRLADRMTRVSLIGGVDLDLTEAEFEQNRATIVKVSLIGGVDLRVPADARVEVHGLSIGGRDLPADPDGTGGPEIVIRAYGILGGVKVRRAAAP